MLTLEERLTALEKNTAESIHELQANTTIMLGVMQSQGQDIKKILLRLDNVDGHLSVIDGRLDNVDGHLSVIDGRLDNVDGRLAKVEKTQDEHTAILSDHTARFDRVETLLGQILARLPEQA